MGEQQRRRYRSARRGCSNVRVPTALIYPSNIFRSSRATKIYIELVLRSSSYRRSSFRNFIHVPRSLLLLLITRRTSKRKFRVVLIRTFQYTHIYIYIFPFEILFERFLISSGWLLITNEDEYVVRANEPLGNGSPNDRALYPPV